LTLSTCFRGLAHLLRNRFLSFADSNVLDADLAVWLRTRVLLTDLFVTFLCDQDIFEDYIVENSHRLVFHADVAASV